MSTLLWKYYFEDDVDNFRQVLARATYNASAQSTKSGGKSGNGGFGASPGAILASSPTLTSKSPRQSNSKAPPQNTTPKTQVNVTLNRTDINWRDSHGVTLLHHIASSISDNASDFAVALLQLPLLDLYIQDDESGWTALHRALYFGNITIARALMDRDIQDAIEHSSVGGHAAGGLIKIKDREGNSPFDVYGASITSRNIRQGSEIPLLGGGEDEEDSDIAQGVTGDANEDGQPRRMVAPAVRIEGDEIFAFGSNKNFTLGFGDEDDRQFPERIHLHRPDQLLKRFLKEYQSRAGETKASRIESTLSPSKRHLPAAVQYRPIIIQDIQISKLHTAVLTTDPEANLYVCGFGFGGRLGTGDETTRFSFVNINGGGLTGKKVIQVGLGQNHTVAISSEGETFTWGSNPYGQLGYAPNSSGLKDEEPLQLLPRQVFGPLKREMVAGAAASRIHSVVYTSSSLYTFGKNEGQLGLVDSDARSLAVQNVPRKVAASLFSSNIASVSAIDKATICLLENHDVWVFSNYGYTKMSFSLEGFSNYFLKSIWGARSSNGKNEICKIISGGDTICAMSSMGDVFTVHVSQKVESSPASTSTTNPSKIRGSLSHPQRVWSLKKAHMAVRDVDVSQDGSIIICTDSGSVWRRIKRAKIKDASAAGLSEFKPKDYKFSRVPGLTRITAVRSSTFGAYAAVRRDFDVLKTQLEVESSSLWKDVYPLLPLHGFAEEDSDTENPAPRFWVSNQNNDVAAIRRAVLTSTNLEDQVSDFLAAQNVTTSSTYNIRIGTTLSEVRIPVHDFLLGARSEILKQAFATFTKEYFFTIPEVMTIEYDSDGKPLILFQGLDFITVLDLVLYIYSDSVVDVWHHTRHAHTLAFRYRQVRTELMKLASHLEMSKLEQAVRVMQAPPKTLDRDIERAIATPDFFDNGDVVVELDGESMKVHSTLMIQRCPFFEGLFEGRSAGLWLSTRREEMQEQQENISVDLKHVDPRIFRFVLRHIYADADESMFDDVITSELDSFLDLVLEVMSVANELMLDRLAQCCQKLLGKFGNFLGANHLVHLLILLVTTRNVCQLLNAVAPCSVTQFKDAALEYICLNLEGMLEDRYARVSSCTARMLTLPSLLGELDEDLMLELDEVVRQNQLACLPISKSGRAEAELLEFYPELADLIERGKKVKIDSVSLQTRLHEREAKFVGGSKAKAAFLEDFDPSPSMQNPRSRSSREANVQSKSPSLKPQRSAADLIFDMDDDSEPDFERRGKSTTNPNHQRAPNPHKVQRLSSLPLEAGVLDPSEAVSSKNFDTLAASTTPVSTQNLADENANPSTSVVDKKPWGAPTMSISKLELKDIMAQDSSKRVSNISAGLSLRGQEGERSSGGLPAKMSQRERKKQQQQQALSPKSVPAIDTTQTQEEKPTSPWQVASKGPKVSLKDIIGGATSESPSQKASIARTPSPMTLRQTISGKAPATRTPVTSPASTPIPHQRRSVSTPDTTYLTPHSPPQPSRSSSNQTAIQSIRHNTSPSVEPTLQLSMADILSQQQTEKEIIKEAAAKRSLQEIQEEQAFQEWWDEESRKVKAVEEEEQVAASKKPGVRGKGMRGRGRGGSRGRGRGKAASGVDGGEAAFAAGVGDPSAGRKGGKKGGDAGQKGRER